MNIVDFVFPKFCLRCGKLGSYICTDCLNSLKRVLPNCYECKRLSNGFITHKKCFKDINSVYCYWYMDEYLNKSLNNIDVSFKRSIIYDITIYLGLNISRKIYLTDKDFKRLEGISDYIILFVQQ